LVGKGVCFDTGGSTSAGCRMLNMEEDMGGAATALARRT